MEVYFPPMAAVTAGIVVVGLCFLLRIPIFLIGLLSVIVLIYTIFVHKSMFGSKYKTMSAPEFLKENAPIFIILGVILVALGYILYLFGPKGAVQNAPISSSNAQYNVQESKSFNPLNLIKPKNTRVSSGSDLIKPLNSNTQRNLNRARSNSQPSLNSLRRKELEDEISRRV